MKQKGLLVVFATSAVVAFGGLPVPGIGDLGVSKAFADGGKRAKTPPSRRRAVRARGFYYGGGYYSYRDRDVVGSSFRSKTYFGTPLTGLQSPAGPFDSGFFFDSGLRPHWWNNAPYPN